MPLYRGSRRLILRRVGGSPAYVFRALDNIILGGGVTVQTATIDTGTASADRRIVVILLAQSTPTVVSVVVNGVTLTPRSADTSFESSAIYDGLVTIGSGTNGGSNVVVTWGTATGQAVGLFLWTLTGLTTGYVSSGVATTNFGANVSVTAGDFLLHGQRVSAPGNYAISTELPFGVRSAGSGGTGINSADWTVVGTNASFQIRHNGSGGSNGAWGIYK